MIALIQRVSYSSVTVGSKLIAEIDQGLCLLLGIEKTDTQQSAIKLIDKVMRYRVFEDESGKMNRSLVDIKAELLVISQFTLVADTSKGMRPGFSKGASPELGKTLYDFFIHTVNTQYWPCKSGVFGADMTVSTTNQGPATFILHSA